MLITKICVTFLLLATATVHSAPQAQPILKNGSCPSGYHSSSNYCAPNNEKSPFSLTKTGSCPSGYYSSGNYCLATSKNSKGAIYRSGSCPSGYHSSGNYCLSNKEWALASTTEKQHRNKSRFHPSLPPVSLGNPTIRSIWNPASYFSPKLATATHQFQ